MSEATQKAIEDRYQRLHLKRGKRGKKQEGAAGPVQGQEGASVQAKEAEE